MRIEQARLIVMAVLVLWLSSVTGRANAAGADADTQRIDLHYCQSIPHGRVCFDVTGLTHATVTPSGATIYATNEQICATAIQVTPNGSLTYDDCRRFLESGLTKDGALQVLRSHSQGTFTRSLADSTLTCTYRLAFQEVAGEIRFDRNDVACSGSELP